MNKKIIDKICTPGWINLEKVEMYLAGCKVLKIDNGFCENTSDGEAHWICKAQSGATFELKANYYDAKSWRPLLEWATNKKPRTRRK